MQRNEGNTTPVYHGVDWVPTSAGQILIVAFSGAQALIELRLLGMGRYVSKRGVDPLLSTDRLFIAGWATKTPIPITLYILPIFSAYSSLSFFFFFLFSTFFFFLFFFRKTRSKDKVRSTYMVRYSDPSHCVKCYCSDIATVPSGVWRLCQKSNIDESKMYRIDSYFSIENIESLLRFNSLKTIVSSKENLRYVITIWYRIDIE